MEANARDDAGQGALAGEGVVDIEAKRIRPGDGEDLGEGDVEGRGPEVGEGLRDVGGSDVAGRILGAQFGEEVVVIGSGVGPMSGRARGRFLPP
jgi:hypothetical protein